MSKTVFIPLTDDLVYERPEQISGRVVPFTQTARVLLEHLPGSNLDRDAKSSSQRAGWRGSADNEREWTRNHKAS